MGDVLQSKADGQRWLTSFMPLTSTLSYASQKLKETANSLKLRPEGFSKILKELGFHDGKRLGTTGEGGE